MTVSRIKTVGSALFFSSMLLAFGCHKKVASTTPPPPPPSVAPPVATPAPTITLRATPTAIDRGGSLTLTWESRNAASVSITPAIGDVAVNGNRSVSPTSSVTYTATATGPGGTASDTARITVNIPPAPAAQPPTTTRPNTTVTDLPSKVSDILFDYDKADIKPDQLPTLQANVTWFKANPNVRFTIEGHCDERGSEEYNIGLGDRRANAVKEYLASQGVAASRMNIVSYGEERPICRDQSEDCFTKNRRAAFTLMQ